MPNAKSVTILNMKPTNKPGSLKAFVSIEIGGFKFHDCRLIQQEGQIAWVSPGQTRWTPPDGGKMRYKANFEWPEAWTEAIREAIVTAYEAQEA